jgi:D-alanyl-D-alanine carboxypeptidase/D-alanyl-D-alanine-endopeptidase (penicillin-binding protein 4)
MRSRRASLLLTATLSLGLIAACASRSQSPRPAPTAAATAQPAQPSAIDRLRTEIASTLDGPAVSALWAVEVQSLETGEILFERNAHTLVMPASNMKILTMAVAAERLGWDFHFRTQLTTTGTIDNGVLRGDLVVVGGGDPTISDRGGDRSRVFAEWAAALKARGITRIDGRIVGDDNALADLSLGDGWAWDDLHFGYATPGGALQFNENVVVLVVKAGKPGEAATATLEPGGSGLVLSAAVTTTDAAQPADVRVWRRAFDSRVVVNGSVPATGRDYTRQLSVDNPTQFFVTALRDTLVKQGIDVTGAAVDIDDIAPANAAAPPTILHEHLSPTLAEIGATFMKSSQNLFGETLMAEIGLRQGAEPDATVRAARKDYEDVLAGWGVPPAEIIVSDGSGLSRYNYVTANALVTILRRLARDARHAAPFEATLPIMGKDGTLSRRMQGTAAEGNVRAKTGTIANVRALSGYLTTAGGERLVFSIVANNFKAPSASVDALAEHVVERLVAFKR